MTVPNNGAGSSAIVDTVADWLMSQALANPTMEQLVEGCCVRLRAAGIPLCRGHVAFNTLHPQMASMSMTWHKDQGVEVTPHLRGGDAGSAQWKASPLYFLIQNRVPFLRRRLTGPEAMLDFPILHEFRDEGFTDYLAYVIPFGYVEGQLTPGDGIAGSWMTDRESGFSDSDIHALRRIQKRLAVAFRVLIKDQVARNVVTAYLGSDAGRRVLNGNIRRGDGDSIHAVIWLSDLRDSTEMADRMPPDQFLALLNAYFECTAGAVLAHAGQVLLLIGDAVLAIFPIDRNGPEEPACESALAAARESEARMAELNRQRRRSNHPPLAYGLALHVGDVMYGNIGVPERLQFTVVGPAVNEVARLEALTKQLGRSIVVSSEFAAHLPGDWDSLGRHRLKGLDEPRDVFAPAADA